MAPTPPSNLQSPRHVNGEVCCRGYE